MKSFSAIRKQGLIALAAVAGLAIAGFFALPWLLIAPAELVRSDIIVHLAIDPHSDADFYVSQLYQQGIAKKIVCISSQVSCDIYPADFAARHLMALGVPRENLLTLHLPIRDCWAENLPRVVEYVKAHGWNSALLVVDPVGSRLGGGTKQNFGQAGISVAITYSPRDREEIVDRWWRTHWKAQRMISGLMNSGLDRPYAQCR